MTDGVLLKTWCVLNVASPVQMGRSLKVIPMGRFKVGYLLGLLNIFLVFIWVIVFSKMMAATAGFGMNFAPVTMSFVYFMMLGLDLVGLSLCFRSNTGFEQVVAQHGRRYAIYAMVVPVPAFFLILAMA
jgi:hypothetical protein